MPRRLVRCRLANFAVVVLAAVALLLSPAFTVIHDLADPAIRNGGIPQRAWKLHRTLSPKFAKWARARAATDRGLEMTIDDISGTEWPLFGCAFYLWATESLQDEWNRTQPGTPAPNIYAREAIEAATDLILDPKQAGWVQKHWGTNYLKTENVFYRMLLIGGLTSHARLTGSQAHFDVLRDQVESLSAQLAASKYGLLDDYPAQCFPGDVVTAIAMVQQADRVLGTDHSQFCREALRGFQGQTVDQWGLVPYFADANAGRPIGPSRGCGNSYVSLTAPLVWPEQARRWYAAYEEHFWEVRSGMAGFREFAKDLKSPAWYVDVDAGPVVDGFGFAASAYGLGAARVNGRMDHAYPLTAELYGASWPLPNGTLLLPRLLSNAADAPYLGEAGILYNLTRTPAPGFPVKTGGSIPTAVFIGLAVQLLLGTLILFREYRALKRWLNNRPNLIALLPDLQFKVWAVLMLGALASLWFGLILPTALLLVFAQFFPGCRKLPPASTQP